MTPTFDYESLISDALANIKTYDELANLKQAIANIRSRI